LRSHNTQTFQAYAAIAGYFACHLQDEEKIKTLQRVLNRLLLAAEQ